MTDPRMTPTNDAPVTVEQCDRDAVLAFQRKMLARLMSDVKSDRPRLGEDEGDAGTLVQAFAAHRLAALASAPAGDGELLQAAERVQRRVGEWDGLQGWEPRDRFAAFGENLRHDAMTLVTAALARPRAAVAIDADMLGEVMQDAWGEICDDAGAHPSDMKHGRGSVLFYSPSHWTDLIARRLSERLSGPRAAVGERVA